jgi:hypothetical protein
MYIGGAKGEGTLYFKIEPSIFWRASVVSFFFFGVMGQSNWLIEKKRKKKIELGRHLI